MYSLREKFAILTFLIRIYTFMIRHLEAFMGGEVVLRGLVSLMDRV